MDKTEIIALLIVGIAVILLVLYFFRKKGDGACGADCFKRLSRK